ncbi:MAG: barstar family protein [Gemmataceae bacterium]
MDLNHLLLSASPWVQVVAADASEVADAAAALDHSPGVAARVVRGRKMRNAAVLFDEVAAALQFPPYFGENWDALDECLADLGWLRVDAVALVILDAAKVLDQDGAEARRVFWEMLERVSSEWTGPASRMPPHRARVFRVLLQCSAAEESQLRTSLVKQAGLKPE